MSFIAILETLFIGPLKLIFEIIFQLAYDMIGKPGISIIALSLVMNVLVLPLYKRADAMQEKSRDIEAKLHDGVTHIKKTFSGDERMMILQAYYRQNNYKPTDVLHGSVSLLLEIPFFMAAYQFLSHLHVLSGEPFGPIKNLGAPDGLLVIGGITINLLPVLMTLINVVASAIYLKGFPLKTKLQLYGMAAFFLWFLYDSPAGLVFYWTLNNLFSLGKNIFYKFKNPKKAVRIFLSVVGIVMAALSFLIVNPDLLKAKRVLRVICALMQLPVVLFFVKSKIKIKQNQKVSTPNKKLFVAGAMFLTLFIGLLIPGNFIADSPQEYVDLTFFFHPLWYLVSSLCFAAGMFLVWMGVFYWLASDKGKVIFERIIWVLCGGAVVNYMFFGTKLGIITSALTYENGVRFDVSEQILNAAIIVTITIVLYLVIVKWSNIAKNVLLTAAIALAVMSVINVITINKSINEIKNQIVVAGESTEDDAPQFMLSKDGNNVVVIMLDRAMGDYVPYILNEKPELKEKFDGFTYYSNTISFGGHTNMGVPALMGGYEYTPVEMNKRSDEALVDKHNESIKVMPALFTQNGYNVTVCDMPYTNYKSVFDTSVYDDYPGINTYVTKGYFSTKEMKESIIESNKRNFFCLGVMKSLPLFMQRTVYNGGSYNQASSPNNFIAQKRINSSMATGRTKSFMDAYLVLENLETMTKIDTADSNNFLLLCNDTTHEPIILQSPNFVPESSVDNTKYDNDHKDRFNVDGKSINITNNLQMMHYQTNMAALMRLSEWFDYLKENDVYDNTKIILVADHGYYLDQNEQLIHGDIDANAFFPLLMVKDFGSTGEMQTNFDFMTNADVPTLAFKDAVENPVNPFTGKPINSDEKTAHDQLIITSKDYKIKENNGNTFMAATWAAVSNNIWDRDDWEFYNDRIVLKEHELP
ncbi:MAG: YidC/Oxa1 family membrane protein insertase [Clostridia bacterium]|nr:YidC/Oxa1 family membrane protein insertase [Clostridia bacterium]